MWDFFRVTPKTRKVKIKSNKGVIFSNPPVFKKGLFYLGNLFLFVSVGYLVYLYLPLATAIANFEVNQSKFTPEPTAFPTSILKDVPTPKPTEIVTTEFKINIPRISAVSDVAPKVSPFDSTQYLKILDQGVVAQSSTSANPGDGIGKSIYIFAHSTEQSVSMVRKNAVFYLLGEMKNGDTITVDFHGKRYLYRVYKQVIASSTEIKYLTYSESDKEVLILQTCWPIGTAWKRLLVFAELI